MLLTGILKEVHRFKPKLKNSELINLLSFCFFPASDAPWSSSGLPPTTRLCFFSQPDAEHLVYKRKEKHSRSTFLTGGINPSLGHGPDSVSPSHTCSVFFPCSETFPLSDFGVFKCSATSRLKLSVKFLKMRTPEKKGKADLWKSRTIKACLITWTCSLKTKFCLKTC